MTREEFDTVVTGNFKHRVEILNSPRKARVPAACDDRLIQFKRMAAIRQCTVGSAAIDLATKQFTDIIDMAARTHAQYYNLDYLKELCYDVQNYLDILIAIVEEEHADRSKPCGEEC